MICAGVSVCEMHCVAASACNLEGHFWVTSWQEGVPWEKRAHSLSDQHFLIKYFMSGQSNLPERLYRTSSFVSTSLFPPVKGNSCLAAWKKNYSQRISHDGKIQCNFSSQVIYAPAGNGPSVPEIFNQGRWLPLGFVQPKYCFRIQMVGFSLVPTDWHEARVTRACFCDHGCKDLKPRPLQCNWPEVMCRPRDRCCLYCSNGLSPLMCNSISDPNS